MANLLAFSTLGCPAWDIDRIILAVHCYGYDSVELRGYGDTVDLPQAPPFTPAARSETRARFADAGIPICCVSSSGVVTKGNLEHLQAHLELAAALGCPIVRIFGGALDADTTAEAAWDRAAQNLRTFGDAAHRLGIRLVLETHDSFSTGESVAKLIKMAAHPSVSSLWDLHHPFREGEPIAETAAYLTPTLGHIHVKDSRPDGGYTLLGEGDIPLFPMLDLALADGYSGTISLEWEKRWHPDIAEPEEAFPQYARALRTYLNSRSDGKLQ